MLPADNAAAFSPKGPPDPAEVERLVAGRAPALAEAFARLRQSEARYRTLFESIDEGFGIIERLNTAPNQPVNFRCIAANRVFSRQAGFADVAGMTMRDVLPGEREEWFETYDRVAQTGEPIRFVRDLDTTGQTLEVYAFPVDGPGSGRVGIIFQDVTQRKHDEAERDRLLREVETERARLADVFEHAPSMMVIYRGPDHVVEQANTFYRQWAGDREVIGKPIGEVFPELVGQGPIEALDLVYATGEPQSMTGAHVVVNRGDGRLEEHYVDFVLRALRDPDGRITGVFGQGVLQTERERAERARRQAAERDAFLLTLSDALRPLADPGEIQATASRLLGEHLGVDRVFYAEVVSDGGTDYFRIERTYHTPGTLNIAGRYPVASFGRIVSDTYRAGRWMAVADTETDEALNSADRAAFAAVGVRAYIGVPLIKDGAFVAAFGVNQCTVRPWLPADVSLVSEVAERTWAAVARSLAEVALRESETRYRTLFESIDQGFCTIEVLFDDAGQPVDYVFVEINPAFVRYTGLTDALGKRMRELQPDHEQFWFDTYGRVAMTGVAERLEHEAAALGRWYNVFANRVGEPDQRRVAILFEDITARRQADIALRENRAEIERQAQFLDATLSNVGDYISIWDREGRFTYANRALERLWGRRNKDYVGKTPADLAYPPDHITFFNDAIAQVFRTKRRLTSELPYTDRDGVAGVYEVVFSPVTGLGPRPEFVVGVSRDISALKRREARAAFLADVGDDFARLATPDEIMRVVGDKIHTHFGLDRLAFAYVDELADTVTSIHDRRAQSLPVPEPVLRLSDFVSPAWRRRLYTGQVYAIHDIDADPYAADHVDAFKELDAGALLIAPFVSEGAWRFVIVLQKTVPYRWQQADIDLLQDLAPRLYLAIERARAGAAIRESETRFRTVANLVPDPIWSTGANGRITWCSQRFFDYTGLTRDDMDGDGWLRIIHEDDREQSIGAYQHAVAAGRKFHREHRLRRHDGAYRWFVVRAVPIHNESGQVVQWLGTATDIHDARLARDELTRKVALATGELRSLSRQLLTVQEEERRHLARELHDEIGQALTALNLQLVAARQTPDRLAEAEAIVHDLTGRVSELSMDLRPSVLDNLGLIPAVLWYSQRYESRTGVQVDLRHHGLDRRLAPDVEICAYRIVQEALTNVARHAGVDSVSVQLLADDRLTVVIRDKGRGFDIAATPATGGLGGMRERVQLLDGNLWIESIRGSGAVVTADLPLDRDDTTQADEAP